MLKLEELTRGTSVTGLAPSGPVSIVAVDHIGVDAATVWYKSSEGAPTERMLFRSDEAKLAIATVGRPWGFDADGICNELKEI